MSTAKRPTYEEEWEAAKARALADAPPFTQAQQAELRRILMPAIEARARAAARRSA